MIQKKWLAGAGVVGVVLAIALFPKPDTGDDIDVTAPVSAPPPVLASTEAPPPAPVEEPPRRLRGSKQPIAERTGANPARAATQARRSDPNAVSATMAVAPMGGIRRELARAGTPEAAELSKEIQGVQEELQAVRADPANNPFADVEPTVRRLMETIRATEFIDNEIVLASVERIEASLEVEE